ncbi:hypothetical protein M404DRAFT_248848 [Pisolithus tinctorius Marx 270]|uniref:Uncharacterized protein n=1 Tax=Pisolithus tinctorius Marx 270 TaxID=870435 RepID=A0A0C3NLS4_PISTI|nr:hypothetical protein M404DRAFT_248848 [Pisolithus tinctorius Marx 270]
MLSHYIRQSFGCVCVHDNDSGKRLLVWKIRRLTSNRITGKMPYHGPWLRNFGNASNSAGQFVGQLRCYSANSGVPRSEMLTKCRLRCKHWTRADAQCTRDRPHEGILILRRNVIHGPPS